jgi:hypothetical protein
MRRPAGRGAACRSSRRLEEIDRFCESQDAGRLATERDRLRARAAETDDGAALARQLADLAGEVDALAAAVDHAFEEGPAAPPRAGRDLLARGARPRAGGAPIPQSVAAGAAGAPPFPSAERP